MIESIGVTRTEIRKKLLEKLNEVFEECFKDEEWLQQQSEIYRKKTKEIDKKMSKIRHSYF